MVEYSILTDTGKVRNHNEDSVIVAKNMNGEYLMVVCDGMGGHTNGEVASSIATEFIKNRFSEISSVGNKQDAINFIKDLVSEANVKIYKYTLEHPESVGMGTTLVLVLVTKEFLLFGNIGDSSGFVYKNKKLHKITVDHTLVNLLLRSGRITEKEALEHPKKNVLLKALGAQNSIEMDIFDVERDVDGVLLCSDGLTNLLDNDHIARVITSTENVEDITRKLIVKCNNRGGNDNITVAYMRMVK